MAARTDRNFRKLARPLLNPRIAQTAPTTRNAKAARSIRDRRRHMFRRFVGRAVIGRKTEEILYLKKPRARRANVPRESGSEFTRRDRGSLLCFVAHAAVFHAVRKIDYQADDEPDDQSNPSHRFQASHQSEGHYHAQDRDNRHQGSLEWPD
jgi:hypothetical protein